MTEREEALEPCPFCGGTEAEPEADRLQGTKWGRVVCRSCGACGEEVRTDYDTSPEAEWHAEAIAAWNRRPLKPHAREEALEEAAKVAEMLPPIEGRTHDIWNRAMNAGRKEAAHAIRALKSSPLPKGG